MLLSYDYLKKEWQEIFNTSNSTIKLSSNCTATIPEEGLREETETLDYFMFFQHSGIQELLT